MRIRSELPLPTFTLDESSFIYAERPAFLDPVADLRDTRKMFAVYHGGAQYRELTR